MSKKKTPLETIINSKNAEYWRKRAEAITNAEHKAADVTVAKLDKIYSEASRSIRKDIQAWYGKFAENNEISIQTAKKWLTKGQLKEFKWDVDEYIRIGSDAGLSQQYIKELINASSKVHVSRLEAIQTHINHQIEMLHKAQETSMVDLGKSVILDAYGRATFDVFQKLGFGWDKTMPNEKVLNELLKTPWTTDGKTFSDRIWENKRKLVNNAQKTLIQSVLRGDSQQEMNDALMKLMDSSRYNAGRLVHTETTYFNALADKQVYDDLGVEEFEVIATLDEITCPTCGAMDGMIIPIEQFTAGVSVPPYHPNCRCTTAPAIDDYGVTGERIARDTDGNTYDVPRDMTYEEWKNGTYVKKVVPKATTKTKKDDIINVQIASFENTKGISAKFAEGMKTTLRDSSAPEAVKRLFFKYQDEIKCVKNNHKRGAFFRALEGGIQFNEKEDVIGSSYQKPFAVVFHEFGHNLDWLLGGKTMRYFSNAFEDKVGKKLEDIMRDDYLSFKKSIGAKTNGELISILKAENMTEYQRGDLSDCLEKFTGNSYPLGIGHGTRYHKKTGKTEREFFAEIISSIVTTPESFEQLKRVFPTAVKAVLDELEKEMQK